MLPATLVIPVRDLPRETFRCLAAVRAHTGGRYEAIVVDNASGPRTRRGLERLARGWPELRVLRKARNSSFAGAINAGMRAARGRFVVWLNNDALVGPQWLSRLMACARRHPGTAAVGPCTDDPAAGAGRRPSRPPPLRAFDSFARAWAARFDRRSRRAGHLTGFCLLLEREAALRVGLLDERLVWGEEDDDYCFRLRQAGYSLRLALDVFVRHPGGGTRGRWTARRRRELARRNHRILYEKWVLEAGRIAADLRRQLKALE